MNEIPNRPVIHFQPTFGKLGDQPAQCEVRRLDPLQDPDPVLAGNQLGPVTAHLAGRNTAGLTQPPHPVNRRADANPEPLRRLVT